MRALRIAAVVFAALCVPGAPAQVHMLGRGGMGGIGIGRPPVRPSMPFRNGSFNHSSFGKRLGFGSGRSFTGLDPYLAYGPYFDPFYSTWYADYGSNEPSSQPEQPSVVVMMPQIQMMPPPVPPPPIHPEVREYNWPVSSPGSPAAFVLVCKDQRVESAVLVTLEGNRILYITPDGSHKQMSLKTLDPERTRQRNAERQLKLPWLMGGTS